MFSGPVAKHARFFYLCRGISLSNFFNCKIRTRWEMRPDLFIFALLPIFCYTKHLTGHVGKFGRFFSCRPGFGRFWAILDTFGRKWYNLSSGRKYGLKTKIRPK